MNFPQIVRRILFAAGGGAGVSGLIAVRVWLHVPLRWPPVSSVALSVLQSLSHVSLLPAAVTFLVWFWYLGTGAVNDIKETFVKGQMIEYTGGTRTKITQENPKA